MKVLLVSNQHRNAQGIGNPIMYRMCSALENDPRIDAVKFIPFCNDFTSLKLIRNSADSYDIVHVHFGGLYALLVWLILFGKDCRKFITFHGTDIHAKAIKTAKSFKERLKIWLNQKASFLCTILFDRCGFVAKEMMNYLPKQFDVHIKNKAYIQPLGVDYNLFKIENKVDAKERLSLEKGYKYVLFSDISFTSIKRRDIAESIVRELKGEYKLLIMSGVKPHLVPTYINASDFLLLTSDEEGSPNIIRESLALNKPVFSVDVGDASYQLNGLANSCIISRDPKVAAGTIRKTMQREYTDNTRERLRENLDFSFVNREVINQYSI